MAITGGDPPPGREPSAEQLAGLAAKLSWGESPYVDFAIFTPHGRRAFRILKFEAQIFVDGKLQTRQLRGPSSFEAWQECWAVFRALMISLNEASPATLDGYSRGISQLNALFPSAWGILFCADEIMRSEVWSSTAETLVDKGKFPLEKPWDLVLRMNTYGGEDCTTTAAHWWQTHVLLPCQSRQGPSAWSFIQQVEGTKMLPLPDGYSTQVPQGRPRAKRQNPRTSSSSSSAPYQLYGYDKGKGKMDKGKGKGSKQKGAKPKGDKGPKPGKGKGSKGPQT